MITNEQALRDLAAKHGATVLARYAWLERVATVAAAVAAEPEPASQRMAELLAQLEVALIEEPVARKGTT